MIFLITAHKTCHSTHYFFTKIKNRFKQQSTCTKESFNQIKKWAENGEENKKIYM